MYVAGSRLFLDVASDLASPSRRAALLDAIGRSDPPTASGLRAILARDGSVPASPDAGPSAPPDDNPPAADTDRALDADPSVVAELIEGSRSSIAALTDEIRAKSGQELVEFIAAELVELKRLVFDLRSHRVFMSAVRAAHWLNGHLETWLGE